MRLRFLLLILVCLCFFGCSGISQGVSTNNRDKPLAESVKADRIAENAVFEGIEMLPELPELRVVEILPEKADSFTTKVLKKITIPPPKYWPFGETAWYLSFGK